MIQVNLPVNLYTIDDLKGEGRETAIREQIIFLDTTPVSVENENGELEDKYFEHTKEEAIENMRANEYLYFADGEIADITHYCGKHDLSGYSVFTFQDQKVFINL